MFISKKEYNNLLNRITAVEKIINGEREDIFNNWKWTRETLYEMMSDFFNHSAEVILVQRDRDKIIGELRGMAMDNIFKEDK